jgi:hypothetical protein
VTSGNISLVPVFIPISISAIYLPFIPAKNQSCIQYQDEVGISKGLESTQYNDLAATYVFKKVKPISISGMYLSASYQPKISLGPNTKTRLV